MDGVCLRTGIHHHGINPSISVNGYLDARPSPSQVSAVGRTGTAEKSLNTNLFSRFSFRYPLKSLWPGGGGSGRYNGLAVDDAVMVENGETKASEEDGSAMGSEEGQNGNWVLKILHVRSLWGDKHVDTCVNGGNVRTESAAALGDKEEAVSTVKDHENESDAAAEEKEPTCDGCRVDDGDEKEVQLDRDSFSRLLRKVSLAEARLYAQMSYLGSLAYSIPKIKPRKLLQQYGLHLITSSIEKKELAAKSEKDQMSSKFLKEESNKKDKEEKAKKINEYKISASAAHEIAASAAAYLHSRTKSILPFKSSKVEVGESATEARNESGDVGNIAEEVASFMATTDSVTAVVAAKEEVKQAVADDLKSTTSSPCEWFVCDDDEIGTRYFVIQGSETLQSWQANLLFEPIKFEGMDVPVHRGIYEAAKGIYEQMLPEVQAHLKSHGDGATFRFTGHSLGGSLALLVNLMLLIREEVPVSSLLPVITFGAPCIMCGGDNLLDRLGLPRSHVQAIMMHRDIVPRAFSCNYPGHVAELLKAISGNFRNHPCLNNQKLLYAPMGELLILQPDEKFSPPHHLLPSGSGLYLLSHSFSESNDAEKHLMAAKLVLLNSPHPLEILSDRSAYGSEGTIQRDHDMNSYLKSVRSVIRKELNRIRSLRREEGRKVWWPLVLPQRTDTDVICGKELVSAVMHQGQVNFSGILETGKHSMTRFSRLVASQHMQLLVVLMFPAKLLLLGAYNIIRFR